jgi:hypothetical protein
MIYEILCNETNEKYIGSTFRSLSRRLSSHKHNKSRCSSKNIIDRGNFTIKVIETLENPSKEELLLREKHHINNNTCVNILNPIATKEERKIQMKNRSKEWQENNKEHYSSYLKDYQTKNAEKIKNQRSEAITCSCGVNVQRWSLYNHKKTKFHLENEKI